MSSRSFADNSDVLERHSHNKVSENAEDTIISRFERQVAAFSDNLAIVTGQTSLSYRALDQMASRIAAALLSLSSEHNRPIVLFIQNDAARVAAMLGVLKAGRIFIPVAPDSPEKWYGGRSACSITRTTCGQRGCLSRRDGLCGLHFWFNGPAKGRSQHSS
jgi:non-ribosomal peptide synthetase component F